MKILTKEQIKEADKLTARLLNISSLELMEKAAIKLSLYIEKNISKQNRLFFIIGKGNNGGDGLAMARILCIKGYDCVIFIPPFEGEASEEFQINLNRLPKSIKKSDSLKELIPEDIIIDALLGSGVIGRVRPYYLNIIKEINASKNLVISIDIPSGMNTEQNSGIEEIIEASITLTIQFPKLSMLLSEKGALAGKIEIIDIGIATKSFKTKYELIDDLSIADLKFKSNKFDYKNKYGHNLLISGCQEMMGAAILSTSASLPLPLFALAVDSSQVIFHIQKGIVYKLAALRQC